MKERCVCYLLLLNKAPQSQWLKSSNIIFRASKGRCDRPLAGLFGDIHATALGDQLGSLFTQLVVV